MSNTKGIQDYPAGFKAKVVEHAKALRDAGVTNWQTRTNREFGVNRNTVATWVHAAHPDLAPMLPRDGTRGVPRDEPVGSVPSSFEQTEKGDTVDVAAKNVPWSTPEEVMREAGLDPADWDVVSFTKKRSESLYVPRATRATDEEGWVRPPGDEHARVVALYHVSATFKKKVAVVSAREEIDALLEVAKSGLVLPPLVPRTKTAPTGDGMLLELGPLDHHVGKMAWPKETGDDPYDVDIAVETYRCAIRELVARSGHRDYEKALFLIGQDMLHVAGPDNTTVAGTPQDVDGRFPRIFRYTWEMVIEAVKYVLENVGPVTVVSVPGNHDGQMALCVADVVSAYFHNQPFVEVRASPKVRKYEQWGVNMLGFAHLDGIKPDELYRLMAHDEPQMWAATKYREWHVGHPHTKRTFEDEINGVRVRCLATLTPPDRWHAGRGYVGNVRASEAFQWHDQAGLVGTASYYHRAN